MIYSFTLFYNEFDLLNLKIAEEIDIVDKFIISEADRTFVGNPKPLALEGKFDSPKIETIFVRDFLPYAEDEDERTERAWLNEQKQRNAGEREFQDDDIIIISDVDEIINKEEFPKIFDVVKQHGCIRLNMFATMYKINLLHGLEHSWCPPMIMTGKYYNENKLRTFEVKFWKKPYKLSLSFDLVRKLTTCPILNINGWHFGYLLTPEMIKQKLNNFSHVDCSHVGLDQIKERMRLRLDVLQRAKDGALIILDRIDIDERYPKTILNNLDFWKKYIEEEDET